MGQYSPVLALQCRIYQQVADALIDSGSCNNILNTAVLARIAVIADMLDTSVVLQDINN